MAQGDQKSLVMTENSRYADGFVTLFRAPGNGMRIGQTVLSFSSIPQKFITHDIVAVDASGKVVSRVPIPFSAFAGTEPIPMSVEIPASGAVLVTEIRLVSHGLTSADHARGATSLALSGIDLAKVATEPRTQTPPVADRLVALGSNDTAFARAALIEICNAPNITQKIPSVLLLQLGRDLNRDVAFYACKAISKGVSDVPDIAAQLWEIVKRSPFEHNQMFAMKALSAIPGVAAVQGGEDYAAVTLTAEDWQTREAAVELLGKLKSDAAQTRLLVFVADPDPRVRRMLCRYADLKNDLANQRLLYLAVNDPYEAVRGEAYARLLTSPKESFRKEATSFFNDESPAVPAFVVANATPFSLEIFQKALVHRSPKVRAAALRRGFNAGFGFQVGIKEIEPVLTDEDVSVQYALVTLFSFHRELVNTETTKHLKQSKFAHIREKVEKLK
ncbi:MAG: HEAT repeat domain-containing protein [Armatimonadetes bacterium]|nr:HEAT repeat domain-containing protein [Armatimonadota bacterium]